MTDSFIFGMLCLLIIPIFAVIGQPRLIPLAERIPLTPWPRKIAFRPKNIPFPMEISISGLSPADAVHQPVIDTFSKIFSQIPGLRFSFDTRLPFNIEFVNNSHLTNPESYVLEILENGIHAESKSPVGGFYAAQTLYQLIGFSWFGANDFPVWEIPAEPGAPDKKYLPLVKIEDAPAYPNRALALDLGRAVFSKNYIMRIIRIMAHLKLNWLHLRLYDDELCSFRFQTLPCGSENPFALTAEDLKEIVTYARHFHVTVMPELESWGHVQSLVYHFPALRGAYGMYGGASFQIGGASFDLLEKIYDEIIPCLENPAFIHVGLDEAVWAPDPEMAEQTPTELVARIYEILERLGAKHQKKIQMYLWADHGGRPLPPELEDQVVVQPWKYRNLNQSEIRRDVEKYGAGKTPFMFGAGITGFSFNGDYDATRIWCRAAQNCPNVFGGTICLWCSNDVAGRFISVFAGADYLWSPDTPAEKPDDPFGELLRTEINRNMRKWQTLFPDALPDVLNADRGPEVFCGKYVWPPFAGKSVAPTRDFIPEDFSNRKVRKH